VSAASDSPVPVPCSPTAGLLSEGPRWDGEKAELLWVDIIGSRLHRGRIGEDGLLEEVATI
jgi:sugar lactone lactonase YvrE